MNLEELDGHLDALLAGAGCTRYSASEARADAQEVWRDVREDAVAHGESPEDPFFNFVVAGSVGVFTFFEQSVAIYIVVGEEQEFRRNFDRLAMADIASAKRVLARGFGKNAPDILIPASLATHWLAAGDSKQ